MRRDTSARWSESADPAALTDVLDRMAGDLPPPREADVSTSADGRPRTGAAREGDAEGVGAALAHPVMPRDPLAAFAADDGVGDQDAACAPVQPDGEAEPDPPGPVEPAVGHDTGCEDGCAWPAVPAEQAEEDVSPQAGEAPDEAILSGEALRAEGPVTPPEPQPVAAPGGVSQPAAAIRQSALLTHDGLPAAAVDAPTAAQAVFTVRSSSCSSEPRPSRAGP